MRPRLLLSATTDLTYDQRMARTSAALAAVGYDVLLVGRALPASIPLPADPAYAQHRLRCRFHSGKLFYLEFTARLAWFLLRQPAPAAYGAVDLDTALPVWLAAQLKRRPWVYDAHELFTEVPEVVARPAVQRIWRWIEAFVVPRATRAYTVGPALAQTFQARYGRPFGVVRNVPAAAESPPAPVPPPGLASLSAAASVLPAPRIILYQGALNVGRGLEQLLAALPLVEASARLIICGEGDLSDSLRARVAADPALATRVEFRGFVVPAELRVLTRTAWVGTMLLENRGLSYYYSLANKFFDYVQAGVPQVCIDFPEYRALNEEYEVAALVPDLTPATLAAALNRVLIDDGYHARLAATCARAAQEWNWERERAAVGRIFGEAVGAR
ncbi:MAG: glycosyltransferase [Hymenobacteraceae bacterium]|nr:glycosyltransferase [Hymenobacteraceae bacterium]